MASRDDWKWYGYAGHFIGGRNCAYHLCTRVGGFLVSTVGDYRPPPRGTRETLGASPKSYFETYVFKCNGEDTFGNPDLESFSEIDGERYAESLDAEDGHYRFCEKYAALDGEKE